MKEELDFEIGWMILRMVILENITEECHLSFIFSFYCYVHLLMPAAVAAGFYRLDAFWLYSAITSSSSWSISKFKFNLGA